MYRLIVSDELGQVKGGDAQDMHVLWILLQFKAEYGLNKILIKAYM